MADARARASCFAPDVDGVGTSSVPSTASTWRSVTMEFSKLVRIIQEGIKEACFGTLRGQQVLLLTRHSFP